MINRAKRVFPGMVMSVLLSMPAFAANAEDLQTTRATAGAKHSASTAQQHATSRSGRATQARAVHDSATRKSAQSHLTSGKAADVANADHRSTAAKARGVSPALSLGSNGRIIRRVSATRTSGNVDPALIDDGTLWREQGSVATWQQTGMASWYGGARWQGQKTSAGTRYDQNALTAAHATLPLGTKVRVTSHNGAKSVIVTINDRPGTRTRIIDLSREAAKALGILDAGVGMVTLQPL